MPAPIHVFAVRGGSALRTEPLDRRQVIKWLTLIILFISVFFGLKYLLSGTLSTEELVFCIVLLILLIVCGMVAICDLAMQPPRDTSESRRSSILVKRQRQLLRNVVVQPTTTTHDTFKPRPSLVSRCSDPPLYHHVVVLGDDDDKHIINLFDKEYEDLLETIQGSPPPPYEEPNAKNDKDSKDHNSQNQIA